MGLFDQLGRQSAGQPSPASPQIDQNQMRQEIGKISANPGEYIKARGYRIPDGMNDPSQITQYLLRSGQIGSPRYQMAVRLLSGMRR